MSTVYNLRNDALLLKAFADTLQSPRAEWFQSPFGPVASASWWNAVENGKIKTQSAAGTVSKYMPRGDEHGAYAEFELMDDAGNTTQWQAHGETGEARLYNPGDKILVKFIMLDVSDDYPGRKELVLEILKGRA